MESIKLFDKTFIPYISAEEIENRINELVSTIQADYQGCRPVFLVILNGAAFFAVDFLKKYSDECRIQFLQLKSYEGLTTSGSVKVLGAMPIDLENKHIIVIEDIVDTGITMSHLKESLIPEKAKSVKILSLLDKPSRRIKDLQVDYIGFTIPDVFVVGYGLDYDELGRNTPNIYRLSDTQEQSKLY